MLLLLLLLLPMVGLAPRAAAHVGCVYRNPTPLEMQSRAVLQPMGGRQRRSTTHALNIAAFYADSFNAEPNAAELKASIVDKAIRFWESVLRIRTAPSVIRLSRHCRSVNVTYVSGEGSAPQYYCTEGCSASTTCGHTVIPESHLDQCREVKDGRTVTSGTQGAGVSADYILYISADPSSSCNTNNGILGYAAHCQQEASLDRPIAGYINFCPGKLSTALGYLQQSLFTAQHEILHALGFAVSLYAYFRDANGRPLTPRKSGSNIPALGYRPGSYIFQWSSNVTVNRTYSWRTRQGTMSKPVTLLVLPNVVKEARSHFNCPSLEGVELEDQGEVGVALTHWEKRLLENELMTGTYTHEHAISRLTLAFMEDTGWYAVDYSHADAFYWGKDLGCDFVSQSCLAWMEAHPSDPSPYCRRLDKSGTGIATTSCTVSGRSVGYCVLEKYTAALPALYQYFSSLAGVQQAEVAQYGGGVYLADYCPFVQGFNWRSGSVVTRTTDCRNSANNAALTDKSNTGLQAHGDSSMCFSSDSSWAIHWCAVKSRLKTFGSGCYQYECSADYGLILLVKSKRFQCLSAGKVLNVSVTSKYYLHQGGLVCPSCASVCGATCPTQPKLLSKAIADISIPCRQGVSTECRQKIILLALIFSLLFV